MWSSTVSMSWLLSQNKWSCRKISWQFLKVILVFSSSVSHLEYSELPSVFPSLSAGWNFIHLNLLNPFWPEKPIWIVSNMLGPTSTLLTSVSRVPSPDEEDGELLSEGVLDISLCQEPELDMWTLYSPSSWNKQFYLDHLWLYNF